MNSEIAVIDTSVLAAFLFREPRYEEAKSLSSDKTLYAPTLLNYELQNVGLNKIKKNPNMREPILKSLSMGLNYERLTLVEINDIKTVSLSLKTELTAYDASYLLLSNRLDCPLLTFDQTLQKAIE